MITRAKFMGGSQNDISSANFPIVPEAGRFFRANPQVAGLKGALPPATRYRNGGPIVFVFNNHATNSFTLTDAVANSLAVIEPGKMATVLLYNNSTIEGGWGVYIRTKKT